MGCGESKEHTPFREKDSASWNITNKAWKEYVDRTYTDELVDESGLEKIDRVELRKEMAQTKLKSGQHVVGRSLYLGDEFLSWGRILVNGSLWESYEGVWISSDTVFGSGHPEEFTVMPTKEGGLTCHATGVREAREDKYLAFKGPSFQLGGDDTSDDEAPARELTPEEKAAEIEAKEKAAALAKRKREYPVWRRNADGTAEMNVSKGIDEKEDWKPCELKFEDDFANLSVYRDGSKIGTFKRQIPTERADRTFEGQDLIFGDNLKERTRESKEVSLHVCKIDRNAKTLFIVYSYGRSGKGKPGSVNVPIPPAMMDKVSEYPAKWEKYLQPLTYHGKTYRPNSDEIMKFMALWIMMDIAVTIAAYTIVFSAIALYESGLAAEAAGAAVGAFDGAFSLLDFF